MRILQFIVPNSGGNIRFFFLLSFFLFFISSFSQQQTVPLNREYNLWLERQLNNKNNFSHTAFKPYLFSKINYDSLEIADSAHFRRKEYQWLLTRKLKSESLFVIDSGEFHCTIDPLFNFQYGMDFADTSLRADTLTFYTNTRGFIIRADFGKKVSAVTSFLENQSFFPQYIDDFVKTYQVVPGNGRVKPFKVSGYDYAMASGYVSFSPVQQLNFQAGHDKNFIGEGYRSLLLSDNAFNSPFFKITSSFWKNGSGGYRIQYTNMFSQLSSLERIPVATTPEALFKPKLGAFHYLNFIPWKRLHIGLFEGIIWQRWDNGTKPFNWKFVNPVIFANAAGYGLNGTNNALIGANLKLKILKGLVFYSQLILDDGIDREGYQFGLKSFDLFTLKNLNFQVEYNNVLANTYSHDTPLQSYSHYNQPLAHPLGSGFDEIIAILDYKRKDFFVQAKFNYANLIFQDYKIGYLINRKTGMNIYLGFIDRLQKHNIFAMNSPIYYLPDSHTQLLYFGIRTSLSNQYLDF